MEGLRVIDASIMPTLISGNTQAPSITIGEKGARHVINGEAAPQMRRKSTSAVPGCHTWSSRRRLRIRWRV
jgi:choline dehydrogenase-like flavoprotein